MWNLTRQEKILLFSLVAILGLGMAFLALKRFAGIEVFRTFENDQRMDLKNPRQDILVFVKGAVEDAGIYRVPLGSRLMEAIQKARLLPQADLLSLPLADFVKDGQTIVVPEMVRPEQRPSGMSSPASKDLLKVNINAADVIELDGLPGIGPGIAAKIVDYRKENPFICVEDLLKVPGIGPKKFDEIKDKVCVQ